MKETGFVQRSDNLGLELMQSRCGDFTNFRNKHYRKPVVVLKRFGKQFWCALCVCVWQEGQY